MSVFLALLRAINVGGHVKVTMADLRDLCKVLGLADVRSLLNIGNLVFRAEGRSAGPLERVLEKGASKRLGLQTEFFVRTAEEWQEIIARNPFHKEAVGDPGHLVIMFLKRAPQPQQVRDLQAAITGPERIWAKSRQAYIVYPDGIGRSRLTVKLVESKLGTRGTGRNWNTVVKLGALSTETVPS